LTGTPVENRLSDLWCIVDTVRAGSLGTLKDFNKRYEQSGDPAQSARELSERLSSTEKVPAMMRRLKKDHLTGLPAIEFEPHECLMPPAQAAAYSEAVSEARRGMSTLKVLAKLRNVSLHPVAYKGESLDEYVRQSARLSQCFDVLDQVKAEGGKALVFIEARAMQSALVDLLPRRYGMARAPLVINGAVGGATRQARVDQFQSTAGFDVMLISPKAGGVGLTLTAANHVIHLSRWWNPAVEDQCTDRAYRIGQDKPVTVHLMLAKHPTYGAQSFDLMLHQLLERKRALSREALTPVAFDKKDADALLTGLLGSTV